MLHNKLITGDWRRTPQTDIIKEVAKYRGLTVEGIGKLCQPPVTKGAISQVITGIRTPEGLIRQICKILDMPDTVLFPWTIQRKRKAISHTIKQGREQREN